MRIAAIYSHLNGYEWLQYRNPKIWREIERYVRSIDAEQHRTKKSKEKTMLGRMVFSPIELNARLKKQFIAGGWKSRTTNFFVTDDAELMRRIVLLPARRKRLP